MSRLFPLFFAILLLGCAQQRTASSPSATASPLAEVAPSKSEIDEPLISLVWLTAESRPYSEEILRKIIAEALDTQDFKLFYDELTSRFEWNGWVFVVHQFPSPYFEKSEFDFEQIAELRLRENLSRHQAWTSADVIIAPPPKEPKDGLPILGKLAAELAGDHCLVLFRPENNQVRPYHPDMLDLLRSDKPLNAFAENPYANVVSVAEDDPQMAAAVAEARKSWPDFVRALKAHAGESYAVKHRFTDGDAEEFMWVEVDKVKDGIVYGRVGNQPYKLKNVEYGDPIQLKAQEILDWNYFTGGEMVGGYTVKVLVERSDTP